MFLFKKNFIRSILFVPICFLFFSCQFTQIIDLINVDTDNFHEKYNFDYINLKKYQVNGVLFALYTRHNPDKSYSNDFSTYTLRLASYKNNDSEVKSVIVNKIQFEGLKNAKLKKKDIQLMIELKYEISKDNDGIHTSDSMLIDVITKENMGLNKDSLIKMCLNVTVIDKNGNEKTKDVDFIFETKIRKYLLQR